MNIEEVLKRSDYKNVLKYFKEISDIPRGSGNNQAISDYLVEFARSRGLEVIQDEALNVIIYKDASKGYEDLPGMIIQGHMDMVCVKKEDSNHDFMAEGLKLLVEGDFIKADRTTLGADDGIAMAYALALLDDDLVKHPALEVLITTDEETGMDGAKAFDESKVSGKMMINVDSDDERAVWVSCAGGLRVEGTLPLKYSLTQGKVIQIKIGGLKGGHSGVDIHKNRTNAIRLMARLLFELREVSEFYLISIQGGEKDNAIPSYAEAEIMIVDGTEADCDNTVLQIEHLSRQYKEELCSSEPDLIIENTITREGSESVLNPASFEKLLIVLLHSMDGVQTMSSDIKGLVESSLNMGILTIENEEAVIQYALRSSVLSYKHYMRDKVIHLLEVMGGNAEVHSEYPAWEYKRESNLRDAFTKVYEKEVGRMPKFDALHAGLECGIISEKLPEVDMISIGPNMYDIHTPEERLSISSAIRMYKILEKLLENIAK